MFNYNKEYVIASCYKGIGLILIHTRELIQYIENFSKLNKTICCGINNDNNNIYILNVEKINSLFGQNSGCNSDNYFGSSDINNNFNYKMKILVAKIENNSFKLIKEFSQFDSNKENYNITFIDDNNLFLWGNNKIFVYNLSED